MESYMFQFFSLDYIFGSGYDSYVNASVPVSNGTVTAVPFLQYVNR